MAKRLSITKEGIVTLDVKDPYALGALKSYATAARAGGDEELAEKVEAFVDAVEKSAGG